MSTANMSLKEGESVNDKNQFDRRVTGFKFKYDTVYLSDSDDGSEASVGVTDHHSVKVSSDWLTTKLLIDDWLSRRKATKWRRESW